MTEGSPVRLAEFPLERPRVRTGNQIESTSLLLEFDFVAGRVLVWIRYRRDLGG